MQLNSAEIALSFYLCIWKWSLTEGILPLILITLLLVVLGECP